VFSRHNLDKITPRTSGRFIRLVFAALTLGMSVTVWAADAGEVLWQPAKSVSRAESLRIASLYESHVWKPTVKNVHHGIDPDGIPVQTPDAGFVPPGGAKGWWKVNGWNSGVPYKWGGFDTPADFDRSVSQGRWAGDVFTPQKRELNDSAVSRHAAGIDCSGFISRCWRLPKPVSTYQIPKHCSPLPDFDSLKPGDVVNKEKVHVALFVGFNDPAHKNIVVYDVGCPPHWKVARHLISVAYLRKYGFKAWRYRGIRD